jgi:hypothetical protein
MEGMGMQILTMAAYQLPELIAAVVALALLWSSARPGPPRNKGLIGIGLILFAIVCSLAMSVLQAWMFSNNGTATDLQQFFAVLGAVGVLVNLVLAVGLVLIVLGLCQATRSDAQAPPSA